MKKTKKKEEERSETQNEINKIDINPNPVGIELSWLAHVHIPGVSFVSDASANADCVGSLSFELDA